MDLLIIVTAISGLVVLVCILFLIKQRQPREAEDAHPELQARDAQRPRRVVAARNQRARLQAAGQQHRDSDEDVEEKEELKVDIPDNVGTKKRAKLEAKAEKKKMREAEMQAREDRKKRQELEDEERRKAEELALKMKEKQEEEERKALIEKERQEHEEYMKLKAAFSVEEEGFDEEAENDSENDLLQQFISYIKKMKVVVLEDLAVHFKLKTQNVIDRIQELQIEGSLTGVIDDRGKFIYISQEELLAVAKFIKQRGRVCISDLAESSNQLINLNPDVSITLET